MIYVRTLDIVHRDSDRDRSLGSTGYGRDDPSQLPVYLSMIIYIRLTAILYNCRWQKYLWHDGKLVHMPQPDSALPGQ